MIYLHGQLGNMFGEQHDFFVETPKKAIRYLCNMIDGFREELSKGHYRVLVGDKDLPRIEAIDVETKDDIHFVPVAIGSGSGIGTALIGASLVAASFVPGLNVAVAGALFSGGLAMTFGGIGQLLAPEVGEVREGNINENYLFAQGINTTQAGKPVPLVFGERVRTGSVIIAADILTI